MTWRVEVRSALAVTLTFVTGATDATGFIKLGGVFTSVMTGNLVLLGVAVGRGALPAAGRTVLAIACYVLGALVGARIAGRPRDGDPVWPSRMNVALAVEGALFVAFAAGWWASGAAPSGAAQAALLGGCAAALGLQSSAILRLGVSGLSTTYLTGTLTTVTHALVTLRTARGSGRSIAILAALVCGGAAGAAAATWAPWFSPAVVLVPLSVVVVWGVRLSRGSSAVAT